MELLQAADDGSFNPEGSLDMDCSTESSLEESYDPDDGGCFLVARSDDTLVGVAGLIVGTPVEYKVSGASISTAETTAAIRRCCCRRSGGTSTTDDATLSQLLTTLEKRAIKAEATQLIALAYTADQWGKAKVVKPSPQLLERLGYQILPHQLVGIDAVQ